MIFIQTRECNPYTITTKPNFNTIKRNAKNAESNRQSVIYKEINRKIRFMINMIQGDLPVMI